MLYPVLTVVMALVVVFGWIVVIWVFVVVLAWSARGELPSDELSQLIGKTVADRLWRNESVPLWGDPDTGTTISMQRDGAVNLLTGQERHVSIYITKNEGCGESVARYPGPYVSPGQPWTLQAYNMARAVLTNPKEFVANNKPSGQWQRCRTNRRFLFTQQDEFGRIVQHGYLSRLLAGTDHSVRFVYAE